MDYIKKITRSRFGFALISNLITVLVSLVLFRPFWEEGDDVNMALLAEGAYGYREPHILYSNTLYGKIICMLQGIIPHVRWHAVMMYLFTFIMLVTFVYVMAKDRKGRILSVVFLAASFYEIYVAFQFSKVATVIAMLSYLVLFRLAGGEVTKGISGRVTAAAFICMTFAVILRYESFLLATIVALSYGICLVIRELKKGVFFGKLRSYCGYFIPVFVIFIACHGINVLSYSQSGWKQYTDYFASTTRMVDYHYNSLLYDLHGEELADLGVSENDALMFITYQGSGPAFPTTELIDSISALDRTTVDVDFIKAWAANICDEVFTANSLIIALAAAIGLYLVSMLTEDDKLFYSCTAALQAVLCVAVMFYYQYSGRWSHRILYALLLAQFSLLIYMLCDMKSFVPSRQTTALVFTVTGFCIIALLSENIFASNAYKRDSYDYGQLISYMEDNKDCLFVSDVFTMIDYGKYDIFRPSKAGQFDNMLSTDSVYMVGTPVNESIAGRFGYDGPLEALCSRNPHVFLIDSISPETELTYCKEHGDGGSYELSGPDAVGNIMIYSIR